MVAAGNLLGQRQKLHQLVGIFLGMVNGVGADRGVGFHDLPLRRCQRARFEQYGVGDADLANVVQRCGVRQQADVAVRQGGGKARVLAQGDGYFLYIGLGAQDVVASLRVPGFGQAGQRAYADRLDQLVFGHAPGHLHLQIRILVFQPVACFFQLQLRAHTCQQNGRNNGFGHVVDRAGFQAMQLVFRGVHARA